MENMKNYILNENNKGLIADAIYNRYYERYLKLFFYKNSSTETYFDENNNQSVKNVFQTEYKNGFLIMASCSLLIETLASYLNGDDKTPRGESPQAFESIFNKARQYSNNLVEFQNKKFYQNIRCAILHQGETYSKFKIKRSGSLFDQQNKEINASKFVIELHNFLKSYAEELKNSKWDSEIWDNCRVKIRHIVKNTE